MADTEQGRMTRLSTIPVKQLSLVVAAIVITIGTFYIDVTTPPGVALGVFPYFIVIFLTSWSRWQGSPFLFAAVASVFTIAGYLLTTSGHPQIILINRLFIPGALWLVAIIAFLRIRQNAALIESRAASETNRRFRRLIEGSNLGIYIATPDRCLFVNQALVDMLGYGSTEELLNTSALKFVAPHDGKSNDLNQPMEKPDASLPQVHEFDAVRKDGSIIHLQETSRWIDWEDERAVSRVFIDVTARKRAQDALAANEERMRLMIDSLDEGVFGTDAAGFCTFCNPAALRLLGYNAESAIVGQDIHVLIHHSRPDGSPLDKAECPVALHRHRGIPYRSDDDVFWRSDGSSFPVAYRILPLTDNGESKGSVTVFSDLSASRRSREILLERDKTVRELQSELRRATQVSAMGQVSAIMAHELHQPLAAVLNTANAMRRWMQDGTENRKELLEEMVPLLCEQAEKAGHVVRRIRNLFEKGETGKAMSDLNAVIEETCTLIAVEFQSANIQIDRRFDHDLPHVPIDKVQIQQVVYNLLRNAVEAVADSSVQTISVTTRRIAGDTVEVCVQDSGTGLGALPVEDLFAPFVTTKSRGMGLGLYTCKTILEAHNGAIWAKPIEGAGAAFHFTIPTNQ